ncbi:KRAB-A domain-containing protein 2 [Branchiostoma belcheri]|nr:KRAB-A domain-containing protein 2 [Branchiostoma belcheri]
MAEDEQQQKAEFYRLVEEHISSVGQKKKDSLFITQERYDKALQALQQPKGVKCRDGNKFKFWATQHFKNIRISGFQSPLGGFQIPLGGFQSPLGEIGILISPRGDWNPPRGDWDSNLP